MKPSIFSSLQITPLHTSIQTPSSSLLQSSSQASFLAHSTHSFSSALQPRQSLAGRRADRLAKTELPCVPESIPPLISLVPLSALSKVVTSSSVFAFYFVCSCITGELLPRSASLGTTRSPMGGNPRSRHCEGHRCSNRW